ncbi:L-gulonolactone oxidase 3 [Vitis vinifera]|uniref:L-gulonolactone oxidase n=1 Tax=Vitis vinifera TaxID=29760 RepID=A0A438C238_VITVI|nr:L-gulonolactone oxidase 3 [Vitis vinifera]
MGNHGWLLGFLLNFLLWGSALVPIHGMPPPSPVQCNGSAGCILRNSYGEWGDRKDCRVLSIAYPETEEEMRLAVAQANQKKQKVKVVSGFSHTIPKLACPGKEYYSGNAVLISTAKLKSTIEIDTAEMVVTADSGVGLRDLINRVEAAGLSLVAAPYWEGLSVGGLISTGAHGSTWWGKGGAVHDHVVGLSLVVPAKESEGFAKIIRLEAQDPLLNAAKVSMGILGAISKVKLSLEPGFKRSITNNFTDDAHFEDEFMDHAKKHEFADITWYPSRRTAVYRYDDRVPLNTSGDGINDFLGFQSNSILTSKLLRAAEQQPNLHRLSSGGSSRKMQTSGSCLYSPSTRTDITCAWDPRINGLFFYETTAIFPATKFAEFIREVKTLRELKIDNFCGVDMYNGFLIRFIKASGAYLGQAEDSVVVDFNYYRADNASTPRLNQDVWEEVEQMAFFKYGAKPHWAKNRNLAFLGVQKKYPNFNKFVAAKKQLDPQNIFSSDWSEAILFGKEAEKGDGCALEGQCICSGDRHCSPEKGYFCRTGLVYKEARVCRYSPSSIAWTFSN